MKEYDVIIIGAGAGANLVNDALEHSKTVALVDKGPAGGTCLNVGCIPTKMLVYPADRVMEIREAQKLGITADIKAIDFSAIMKRMREHVAKSHDSIQKQLEQAKDFDYYGGEAHFIGDYTLQIRPVQERSSETSGLGASQSGGPAFSEGAKNIIIKGKTIFLASGARPLIPHIKGIENIEFLTNESALRLTALPESMIIIGGGYIAAEFAHFFEAMGTKVTIIQRNNKLVPGEEPEISDLLKMSLSRRMTVLTDTDAIEVRQTGKVITITAKDRSTGNMIEVSAHTLLIAAGRQSNADILEVSKTGVKTNDKGYIEVDEFLETAQKNIWAFGDAIGKKMFRHSANQEAELVWHNALHGKKSRMNYLAVPHAIFSWPEIASVGLGEEQAIKLMGKEEVLVGKALYRDVARGEAMRETEGFAKAVVHRKTGKILGYHLIGPQASILIQEIVNAMSNEGNLWSVAKGMHIHPALSEVVLKAFSELKDVK